MLTAISELRKLFCVQFSPLIYLPSKLVSFSSPECGEFTVVLAALAVLWLCSNIASAQFTAVVPS